MRLHGLGVLGLQEVVEGQDDSVLEVHLFVVGDNVAVHLGDRVLSLVLYRSLLDLLLVALLIGLLLPRYRRIGGSRGT